MLGAPRVVFSVPIPALGWRCHGVETQRWAATCNIKEFSGVKFKKGVSGNPAGRPKGSRNAITKLTLDMLQHELEKVADDGPGSLSDLRKNHPEAFWRFTASLVPKELDVAPRSPVSFEMILHDPKSLETNDTVINATPETLPPGPTQDGETPANGSKQAILESDTD